eukprot:TRINITY_DN632_c0_g1_i1.p1 TRINITY_DN632_c0_g1~~TRINITY_DN632_c0_g1_i1.p1  ORF type:complete len:105 (+),score=16.08 TRINITY_DN632_c0_g1_i1:270-584(+)
MATRIRGAHREENNLSKDDFNLEVQERQSFLANIRGMIAGLTSTRFYSFGVEFCQCVQDGFTVTGRVGWFVSTALLVAYLPLKGYLLNEKFEFIMRSQERGMRM